MSLTASRPKICTLADLSRSEQPSISPVQDDPVIRQRIFEKMKEIARRTQEAQESLAELNREIDQATESSIQTRRAIEQLNKKSTELDEAVEKYLIIDKTDRFVRDTLTALVLAGSVFFGYLTVAQAVSVSIITAGFCLFFSEIGSKRVSRSSL